MPYKRECWSLLFCLLLAASCAKQPVSNTTAKPEGAIAPTKVDSQTDDSKRTIYPFSIIPGGVRSVREFEEAIENDPVARRHHAGVNLARMHLAVLSSDRKAFVSYRIGDKVYWTAKAVPLKKGEQVLTDGETTIRARCGNQISEEIRKPVQGAAVAPTEVELDTPVELTPLGVMASASLPTALSNLPLGGQLPSIPGEVESGPLVASLPPPAGNGGPWWGGGSGGSLGMPPIGQPAPSTSGPNPNPPVAPPNQTLNPPVIVSPPPSVVPPGQIPLGVLPPPGAPPFVTLPPAGIPPPYYPPGTPAGTPTGSTPPPGGFPPPGTPPPVTPPPATPPPATPPPGGPPNSPPPPLVPPGVPPPPPNSTPGGPPVESVPETATYFLAAMGLLGIAMVRNRQRD